MYFVDRDELDEKLVYIERLSHEIESAEGFALERISHMLIEAVVDVGNMIIDGFVMRDPGSYQDVIDILEMEKVISSESKQQISTTLPLRQWFVRSYTAIDHGEVKRIFMENIQAYQQFKTDVDTFIANELGPVSAFGKGSKNEKI
ncbi:DUF86 domain-containing protein [Macrococcoides caseolyticum]|uniref:DUF86 domain-containing protein n=1 Tax=Macrococcoides caseolyticum TaxID=69966 RepID=UPI001F37C3F7|nr:DUF86 domain-containing protein [Macrococcus caseolyticus]MCE4955791.1 DUF86 domain-containing protein [Macrococcus caseolyticus]